MKYEYLKGSEKDFEGAPEWATAIASGTSSGNKFYLEGMMPGLKYGSLLTGLESQICDIHVKSNIIAERRPITEPSWDGMGLPPVGCECEMQDAVGEFIPVYIIANHDGFAFGWNYARRIVYFSDNPYEFRPIRSEADKRRDEAVEAMNNLKDYVTGGTYLHVIYDAIASGRIPGVKLED